MFGMGMQEMVIIMVVAVLLFGKRLPEVARSLGSSYQQFRKGLQDIQSEMSSATGSYYSSSTSSPSSYSTFDDEDYDEPTAPRFEAPVSEPSGAESGELSEEKAEAAASAPAEETTKAAAREPSEETA